MSCLTPAPGPFIFECELCQKQVYEKSIRLVVSSVRDKQKCYFISTRICRLCYEYAIYNYLGKDVIIHKDDECLEMSKRYRTVIRKHFKKEKNWDK